MFVWVKFNQTLVLLIADLNIMVFYAQNVKRIIFIDQLLAVENALSFLLLH